MDKRTYQRIPRKGKLAKNLNLSFDTLLERIVPFGDDTVYFYVVDTVKHHRNRLYQTGSAPNFQGDLITLCSCKHFMRTARDAESWQGVWIAGYTSRSFSDQHELFYLMKTSLAFESHSDLWFSDSVPKETKNAKAANRDKFGDIFQPRSELGAPYSYKSYFRPCKRHVHCDPHLWHKDIKYTKGYSDRMPALLVGDPKLSFLWNEPIVSYHSELTQGFKKRNLSWLFSSLKDG